MDIIFHVATGAFIRHATTANVLVPLKDVKYERIWKWLHVHPPRTSTLEGRFFGGGEGEGAVSWH